MREIGTVDRRLPRLGRRGALHYSPIRQRTTHNVEVADKPSEGNVLAALGLVLPLLVLGVVLDKDEVLVGVLVGTVNDGKGLVGHCDESGCGCWVLGVCSLAKCAKRKGCEDGCVVDVIDDDEKKENETRSSSIYTPPKACPGLIPQREPSVLA